MVLMNPRKEGMVNEHTPSEQTNVQRDNGDVRRVLCVRVKRKANTEVLPGMH